MALHVARHTGSLRPQQATPCRPLSLQRRRRLVATPAVLAPAVNVPTVEASGGYETAVSPMRDVKDHVCIHQCDALPGVCGQ